MPIIPRIDVAIPTVDAGMPRPPVKRNGRSRRWGLDSEGLWRGVERNSDQILVKAPRLKSKKAMEMRVKLTLRVHIREKGNCRVTGFRGVVEDVGEGESMGTASSVGIWAYPALGFVPKTIFLMRWPIANPASYFSLRKRDVFSVSIQNLPV